MPSPAPSASTAAPRSTPLSISISSPNVYSLERDPNLPPPSRASVLPFSSQAEAGPSSSPLRGSPSHPSVSPGGHVDPMDGEDEDPEFAGLEMIGATQWEREVPTFRKRKSSSINDPDAIDLLLIDKAGRWDGQEEERFATRSPIAGPSSPLRTPAFSLTHTSSDLPSGAYPQTPQTPQATSPISWSPSPLSSRGHSKPKRQAHSPKKAHNQTMIELSDDSDEEQGQDREENDENRPPPIVVDQDPLATRVLVAGMTSISRPEEEWHVRHDVKGKGKAKARTPPEVQPIEETFRGDVEFPLDLSSDLEAEVNAQQGQGKPADTQYSDFDDFPFDDLDLNMSTAVSGPSTTKTVTSINTSGSTTNQRVTRSSQNTPNPNARLEDLFADDDDEDIPLRSKQCTVTNASPFFRDATSFDKGKGRVSILDKQERPPSASTGGAWEPESEWSVPMIPDLPEKWQEFYLNHWRRGADKSKAGDKRRVQGIVSDDEDEDDVLLSSRAGRGGKTGARAGPAAPKRGKWAGRGAWRGRGRGRGKARNK